MKVLYTEEDLEIVVNKIAKKEVGHLKIYLLLILVKMNYQYYYVQEDQQKHVN